MFVTHSIAEAVYLSDRVYVMSPRPGTIRTSVTINLPRPRDVALKRQREFFEYETQILQALEGEI